MAMIRTQCLSVRLPETLVHAVQQASEERCILVSELVRSALLAYLKIDAHTRQLATVVDELATVRTLLRELLDSQRPTPHLDAGVAEAETTTKREGQGGSDGKA